MMKTIFITGTDTGVGKTLVSHALISCCVSQGFKTSGFKPVAAGAEWYDGELQNEDAQLLLSASNTDITYSQVNPCVLELATAPHIAADKMNSRVDAGELETAYRNLSTVSERIVVEGAGGWQVPLNSEISFADWVSEQKWPVLLVVNIKLGCINHARLSYLDIMRCGNLVAGWVANVQSDVDYAEDMIASIADFISAPLLGWIPPLVFEDSHDISDYLDFAKLDFLR